MSLNNYSYIYLTSVALKVFKYLNAVFAMNEYKNFSYLKDCDENENG